MDLENLTRAQRKALKRRNKKNMSAETHTRKSNPPFKLQKIFPKTENQEKVFREFSNGQNILIHGYPGTGKSFISLYLALNEIEEYQEYSKIIIIRSVVPSRDMGYLPGSIKEKAEVYEAPYESICSELYGRGDAYSILVNKGLIEFQTTSFLRGMTFNDAIVIVDEAQNMTPGECVTVLSRLGDNSRLIMCGDLGQNDLVYKRSDFTGLIETMDILKRMPSVSSVEFGVDDIVRSGFVKEYIIAKYAKEQYRENVRII